MILAILVWSACSTTAPTLLGLRWAEDAGGAARQLHLRGEWTPWSDRRFERSDDGARAVLGQPGFVRLIRSGRRLEGVQVSYAPCDAPRLRRAVERDLGLEPAAHGDPYQVWSDDSLVHLATDSNDQSCTLTVAGPRFGRAFQNALLAKGLGGLADGMRPH